MLKTTIIAPDHNLHQEYCFILRAYTFGVSPKQVWTMLPAVTSKLVLVDIIFLGSHMVKIKMLTFISTWILVFWSTLIEWVGEVTEDIGFFISTSRSRLI